MRVMVTGHKGYIGGVLVPMLMEKNYDVIGYDSGYFSENLLDDSRDDCRCITKDIRDVENLIDILITSMHYRFVSKKDGKIEYTHTLSEPSFITQIKLKIRWMRNAESLIMQVNGNTLTLEGINMHIRKLNKTLKQHTFID